MEIKISEAYKILARFDLISKRKSLNIKSIKNEINQSEDELIKNIKEFNQHIDSIKSLMDAKGAELSRENIIEDFLMLKVQAGVIAHTFYSLEEEILTLFQKSDIFSAPNQEAINAICRNAINDYEEGGHYSGYQLKNKNDVLSSGITLEKALKIVNIWCDEKDDNSFFYFLGYRNVWVHEKFEEFIIALQVLVLKTKTLNQSTRGIIYQKHRGITTSIYAHLNPNDLYKISAFPVEIYDEILDDLEALCKLLILDIREDKYYWE